MKESAVSDVLRYLTYKELKRDDLAVEFGALGEEFYLILEGECEVLVPDHLNIKKFH